MDYLFGDLTALAKYAASKGSTTDLDDLAVDAAAAEAMIEDKCGPLSAFNPIPDALVVAGLMVARQLYRARNSNGRAEPDGPIGFLWPKQALELIRPYELPPLGFA